MSNHAMYPESKNDIQGIAKSRQFIPDDVCTTVRKWAATPTVELIPIRYGPRGFEFLLAKRREAPWAGEWFFSGGRILPGEIPEEAMLRACQQELGFTPETGSAQLLLWQSIYNPESVHGGEGYFTLSACWQVWVEADEKIMPDSTQEACRWFTPDEARDTVFPPCVKTVVNRLRRDPARDYYLQ